MSQFVISVTDDTKVNHLITLLSDLSYVKIQEKTGEILVEEDPFYSDANMKLLHRSIAQMEATGFSLS